MSEFKLEIKQIVDYPRCRIYRQLIQCMIKDPNIRTGGSSGLFYYTVLCAYANFRNSYKRIDGISYTVYPGEWICRISELKNWFRTRTVKQALGIIKDLQERHMLKYSILGHGKLVKYKIENWAKANRVLDYNAPCQKETGFFFLPVSTANELVSGGKCGEADAVLDLWINTVYNDEQVKGSEVGPIVYIRNGSGNPLLSFETLAERWGISKATAGRYINKLKALDYIMTVSFNGSRGSAVYVKRYLSTMFEISDILLDKEELAAALNIKLDIDREKEEETCLSPNITVSKYLNGVSNLQIEAVTKKVGKILSLQGFRCFSCPKIQYMLLPLSDCIDTTLSLTTVGGNGAGFLMIVQCSQKEIFRFDVKLEKEE